MIRSHSRTALRPVACPAAAAALLLLAAIAAASPTRADTKAAGAVDDSVLAVYDGGAVYPHDFNAGWWMLSPPQRPPGDPVASRQAFLSSVVDRQILAEEARKRGYPLTPEQEADLQRTRDQFIQNALFDQLIRGLPAPTDEDVERYRRQKSELAEIRFVSFKDWGRARTWRSRLATGTPFRALEAAVAREGAALATADTFRLVAAEQIPDTLANLIWSMRPGQVSDIQSYGGQPTLILLRSYVQRTAMALGENVTLKSELQGKQYARVREQYRQQLAEKVGRRFVDENLRFLLALHQKIRPRNDIDSLTGQSVIRPNLPLPYVTGADTARVLAHVGNGDITIADYLHFWGRTPAYARPEIREESQLEGAVDRIALAPSLLAMAEERGLDKSKDVQMALDNMREGFAVQAFYHDMFESKVKLTEAALRKYYDHDPTHYDDRASVNARVIVLDRRSLADSVLAQLHQGVAFRDLVTQYSIDGPTAAKGGDVGEIFRGSQDNKGLEDAMFATPVGQVGGPERTPQGFVIWRIDRAQPGLKRSYAEARWMVERDYRNVEADRLLGEYLAREKARRHVRYFNERVTAQLGKGGPWD